MFEYAVKDYQRLELAQISVEKWCQSKTGLTSEY